MRRELGYRLPFALMLVLGLFCVVQYYVPHPVVQKPKELIMQWRQPVGVWIIFVALFGLLAHHARKVKRRDKGYGYSVVTLVSAAAMTFVGLVFGTDAGTPFAAWFQYVITPIEATMYSLLAFYVASAAFRAFRARTIAASVLLASALIVLLGLIPAVGDHVPFIAGAAEFLLEYPNVAAKRAILIGVALGAIAVSFRTILGFDRTVLGKGR